MSHPHPVPSSSTHFQLILNNALKTYEKHTRCDLLAHPLAAQLQGCDSPNAILAIINQQAEGLHQSQRADERLTKWLNPTINVLNAFSATLGAGVGLVFSPAQVIFAGIGVLLSAATNASASHNSLIDIFERIENFFQRLVTYTEVAPTPEMVDIIVKIMVEVLSILGIATKQIKQGRTKSYLKKLVGRTDIEDALKKLDRLTTEEARMATAQVLKATHTVDARVRGVDDKVLEVNDKVAGVDDRVVGVDKRVAGVDERVVAVDCKVDSIENRVEGVEVTVASVDHNVKAVDDKVAVVIDQGKQATVAIQHVALDIDEVKRNQLRQELPRWLSPPDPSVNHNIACGAHHKRNAEWFFQGSIFREWKSTGSLLWIHGKPGSGKSILCSTIIQDVISLRDSGSASMAYFYFDFRDADKQNRRDLLPSLISQLSSQSDRFCDTLIRLYLAHDKGARKPSEDALIQCLKDMLTLPGQDPVYIIIDALDECPDTSGMPSPREQVLGLLKELVELSLPNLHLCVTSRPEIDIRHALESLTTRRVSLHEQSGQKNDIIDYVRSVVQSDSRMRRWRDEDKNLVIETLAEKADGMFRWVFCQLEALRYCFPPSVRHILEELPDTLDETYERILRDINKANRDHAHRLLQCLVAAVRPLRVAELAEVLAVDFGTGACGGTSKLNPDWRWDDQQKAVLSTCSSLISIVDENGFQVVQFSHFSVKEYLTSPRLADSNANVSRYHILLEPAHTILAKACLGVLLRLDEQVSRWNVEESFPLAQYAAEHWVDHAKFDQVSSHVREAMEIFFDPDKPSFAAWHRVHDIDVDPKFLPLYEFSAGSSFRGTPLYYAAVCGFHDLTEHLIMKFPQQVNARSGNYVSPLGAALGREHFDVAQLLYEHGAIVDVRGRDDRTMLQSASERGNRQIVEWLLGHGADLNLHSGPSISTPLHMAASNGWVEISQIFLQRNADKNALNGYGRTPLHLALEKGHVGLAELLLEHGVDLNTLDNNCFTTLHLASKRGHINIARYLLAHGVDVNALDSKRSTALHLASEQGHIDVARLLLEHDVGMNALDNKRSTALHLASEQGYIDVARLLLEHGVDGNVQDTNFSTALHLALKQGHISVAQLLLEHGVDVSVQDNNRFTSLHLASKQGHTNIAQFLLEHGVDVNAQDDNRSTALHLALEQGHTDIALFLIEHGVDVNVRDNKHSTALHLALKHGHTDIVQLLLKHGVDVNAQDDKCSTALHLALEQSYTDIVQLLLKHGVDVNVQDYNRSTALHLALEKGHTDIAQFLMEHGVDVNVRDNDRFTALHLASRQGHTDIVQMLFEHGVDVDAWGKNRSTALHLASESGKLEVVCLLLEHGADVEAQDYLYRTPLQVASGEQRDEITKLLSERHMLNSRNKL